MHRLRRGKCWMMFTRLIKSTFTIPNIPSGSFSQQPCEQGGERGGTNAELFKGQHNFCTNEELCENLMVSEATVLNWTNPPRFRSRFFWTEPKASSTLTPGTCEMCVLRRRSGSTFAGVRVWLEQSGSFWRRLPLALKLGPSVLRWTKTRLQIGWGRVEIITLIVASRPRRKRPSAQTTDRCLAPSSQANSLISIIFVFFCLHECLCFCWFGQQSWETSLNLCLLLFPLLVEAANPVNWVNFVFTLSDCLSSPLFWSFCYWLQSCCRNWGWSVLIRIRGWTVW